MVLMKTAMAIITPIVASGTRTSVTPPRFLLILLLQISTGKSTFTVGSKAKLTCLLPSRILLFVLQLGYVYQLFQSDAELRTAAANVGSHFIVSNLLQFAFIMLWVTAYFWIAELMLIINFFNLTTLYFRHPYTNRLAHVAVTAGPLAWTYVAIFMTGAAMVGAHHTAARLVANVFVWSFLGFGLSFLVAFQDYIMGFSISILTACKSSHMRSLVAVY